MLQGHGDDMYKYAGGIELNFSSNISPYTNTKLIQHLKHCTGQLKNYPEPAAESLAAMVEQLNNLPCGTATITNGAVEAFYLIAGLFKNKHSLIFSPSFSEYEDACKCHNHQVTFFNNDKALATNVNRFDLVWLCNPNNPDGKIYESVRLREFISKNPKTTFILDEAYCHFIEPGQSLQQDIVAYKNLIVVSSLTKRYAIPGLRVGYLLANQKITGRIAQKLMPWRINTFAIEAASFCLSANYEDEFKIGHLLNESKRVQSELNKLYNIKVIPTETTFFLCELTEKASDLKNYLIEKHKILIRDASNFRGLTENYIRISIRTEAQNNILINALKEWNNTL